MNKDLSPRHLQLRSMLLRRWKTQGLGPGDKIESQNEIIKFCDYSLITVMKTLKDLEAEGVIRRQVGKGSYLVKTPWAEAHWRIGFFYNRDIVGGGIFDNAFYTRMVTAIEKGVVSDGHEFVLGSFTHGAMPTNLWDALDAVILTGITDKTNTGGLSETTSQISLIDLFTDDTLFHSFRLDFASLFVDMFKSFAGKSYRYLYLDSEILSGEQAARLEGFRNAHKEVDPTAKISVISVNQEVGAEDTDAMMDAIARFQPDVICGYLHRNWRNVIAAQYSEMTKVYGFALDSEKPGFVVQTSEWMGQVLPEIYEHLANRQSAVEHHVYPAKFVR
ncbi:hypothetical protein [Maritalea sp.]|uniref:hypothetical protein n=1 Tax=Maritalea sp. TaxID=2003361 RepID=UPI003EF8ADDF